MDREAAVKLWREIGFTVPGGGASHRLIESFATAVEAAERERCAKHIDVPYERRGEEFADALRNMDVPIERTISVDGA